MKNTQQLYFKKLNEIHSFFGVISGDPVLRNVSAEVLQDQICSNEIQNLINQMKKVLHNYNLVGIAAPQIGVLYRIIVMEASERLKDKYPPATYNARQMDILPLTVGKFNYITKFKCDNRFISLFFVSVFVLLLDCHQSDSESEEF